MVTKEMIKNSMEATWRKHKMGLGLWGCAFSLVFGVIMWRIFSEEDNGLAIAAVISVPYLLIFLLPTLYHLLQYRLLFLDYKNYDIYEVLLIKPTTSYWYGRSVYYTVFFTTNNGQCITRATKAIWSDSWTACYGVSDYCNTKIKIAYNEDMDKIIVLGRNVEGV